LEYVIKLSLIIFARMRMKPLVGMRIFYLAAHVIRGGKLRKLGGNKRKRDSPRSYQDPADMSVLKGIGGPRAIEQI